MPWISFSRVLPELWSALLSVIWTVGRYDYYEMNNDVSIISLQEIIRKFLQRMSRRVCGYLRNKINTQME